MYKAYFSPIVFFYDAAGTLVAADAGASSYKTFEIAPGDSFEESFLEPVSTYTGESISYKKAEIYYTAATQF